ncbi:hypothetical protein NX722_07950 [Endozoicomonas gorgoniicola]|uniref:Uncharacterized protein n=1 Tax=Endozoicomonas gorgoniicola TaxID=1234144 RepID=A0ABT3MTA2_9GAMM|nr:hypothetical protein [Endozoicomonas gorgoniicola]MCW7552582.1 hypothetical protein [Endozoicomonas gorgoniicola]
MMLLMESLIFGAVCMVVIQVLTAFTEHPHHLFIAGVATVLLFDLVKVLLSHG